MAPQHYRLVIKGELGRHYASAFEGMTVTAHDGVTDITGQITDPAHLQGLLERIAGLGLTLHSLTPPRGRERRGPSRTTLPHGLKRSMTSSTPLTAR
jgi:hypothetical protein